VVAPRKFRGALLLPVKFDSVLNATLRRNFYKFQPVSPWIFRVKPPGVRKIVILDDGHTPRRQRLAPFVKMKHREGRMRFLGGLKIVFHSDVQLLRAALEPATSASAQDRRFLDLFHSEERAIKFSRCGFASFGRRDLDVIDARYT
jgi:hypothetical protein